MDNGWSIPNFGYLLFHVVINDRFFNALCNTQACNGYIIVKELIENALKKMLDNTEGKDLSSRNTK